MPVIPQTRSLLESPWELVETTGSWAQSSGVRLRKLFSKVVLLCEVQVIFTKLDLGITGKHIITFPSTKDESVIR